MNNLKTEQDCSDDQKLICRREFFIGLKKWSKIVVGSAVMGTAGASVLLMNGSVAVAGRTMATATVAGVMA